MISTTFNGESVWLMNYPAETGSEKCVLSKVTSRQEGLTMRESREEKDGLIRRKLTYTVSLDPDQHVAMQGAIASWQNQRLLVPFWPSKRLALATDAASHTGHIRIWWNGVLQAGAYEIKQSSGSYPSSPNSLSVNAATMTAPVMYARFESMPEFSDPLPDGSCRWKISVYEVGDATTELAFRSASLTYGATINSVSIPKLTVPVDWMGRTGAAKVRIFKDSAGFSRENVECEYIHQPRITHKISGTAFSDEIAYLLNLWGACNASVKPFWLQSENQAATFIFGRFDADSLTLNWEMAALGGEEIANFQFDFQTLPAEQALPSGETYGVTTGPVNGSGKWFGYKITNSANTWLLTSRSTAVTGSAGTFQPAQIEHGEISESINLQVSDCKLKVVDFAGNPFAALLTQFATEPIWVTIYEGTLDAPMSAAVIYYGRAVRPSFTGNVMNVTLRGFSSWLKTKGPRRILMANCRASIGDSKCGYVQTGTANTLTATSGGILTFASNGFSDHVLRGGWAERTLSDGTKQRYSIADSYASGSNLTVVIFGALTPAATGSETGWKLFRGCDRDWWTCKALGNTANFRGFPRIPATNPSIVALPTTTGGGKK